jgi:hypothetical protein
VEVQHSWRRAKLARNSVIFSLAREPLRTFYHRPCLTGMRAGEALGFQWADIDFAYRCIHIRCSAWCHILEKLNLHNSAELVLYAVRKGIIQ